MPASHTSYRPPVVLWLGLLAFSAAGHTETVVHQQGSSRNVVRQTDGTARTHSTVVRTPSGQKTTTRTGNSSDVTIQDTGSTAAVPLLDENEDAPRRGRTTEAPAISKKSCPPHTVDKKAGRDCGAQAIDSVDDMELAAKRRIRPVPSINDLEQRANSRIRSVSPD